MVPSVVIDSKNPCGEIRLGKPEPVSPFWQIQIMNWCRQRKGLSLLTEKERDAIINGVKGNDNPD